ncbi:pseudouridylate synthase 7 homolog [Symsagittifera roscoffensis]|uniref:pseudouridylate synthase 7 homolog n=1 Tax=Symsagittifera roscoffensis TaxID=84072 RepID=UPI00307BBB5B
MDEPIAKRTKTEASCSLEAFEKNSEKTLEDQFGICCYVSNFVEGDFQDDGKSIDVILKHRFSDFIVNEIDENDRVVNLTSFELPKTESAEEKNESENLFLFEDEQTKIITESVSSKIRSWVKLLSIPEEKKSRKLIHSSIQKINPSLISKSFDGFIHVMYSPNQRDERGQFHSKWEGHGFGNYCSFVLFKEGLSTMEAIDTICRRLNKPTKAFNFAGTKDKRAVTYQNITVFKVEASVLNKINDLCSNIKVGDFSYTKARLGLGASNGNAFKLLLRNIDVNNVPLLHNRLRQVEEKGFINYFGLQRFGSMSNTNPEIGLSILKNDWLNVVNLLLFSDSSHLKKVSWFEEIKKKMMARENINLTKEMIFQVQNGVEKKFLFGLKDTGYDSDQKIIEAFGYLQRNIRLIYLHSYQAYLWNLTVSQRLKKFGLKLVIGDLVHRSTENTFEVAEITADNLAENKFENCVIPIVGSKSKLPPNMSEFILKFLEKDGLTQASMDHKIKEYKLKGDYRKIVCKPNYFKYGLISYESIEEDVLKSDIDYLKENEKESKTVNKNESQELSFEDSLDNEKFFGLKLSFHLPSSAYATMLVRELTHSETSQQYHKAESDKLKDEEFENCCENGDEIPMH